MEEKWIVARDCLPPELRYPLTRQHCLRSGQHASRRWCLAAVVPRGGGASGGESQTTASPTSLVLPLQHQSEVDRDMEEGTVARNCLLPEPHCRGNTVSEGGSRGHNPFLLHVVVHVLQGVKAKVLFPLFLLHHG